MGHRLFTSDAKQRLQVRDIAIQAAQHWAVDARSARITKRLELLSIFSWMKITVALRRLRPQQWEAIFDQYLKQSIKSEYVLMNVSELSLFTLADAHFYC